VTLQGPATEPGSFASGTNGSIQASLDVGPLSAGAFSCPSGQRLVLAFVSYTNVSITDVTNGVTASIPGAFSRCFVSGDLATELCSA
jgi:hypothetical protein